MSLCTMCKICLSPPPKIKSLQSCSIVPWFGLVSVRLAGSWVGAVLWQDAVWVKQIWGYCRYLHTQCYHGHLCGNENTVGYCEMWTMLTGNVEQYTGKVARLMQKNSCLVAVTADQRFWHLHIVVNPVCHILIDLKAIWPSCQWL